MLKKFIFEKYFVRPKVEDIYHTTFLIEIGEAFFYAGCVDN
jgi:hypothetical protein